MNKKMKTVLMWIIFLVIFPGMVGVVSMWISPIKAVKKEMEMVSTNNGCTKYRFYEKGTINYVTTCDINKQDNSI